MRRWLGRDGFPSPDHLHEIAARDLPTGLRAVVRQQHDGRTTRVEFTLVRWAKLPAEASFVLEAERKKMEVEQAERETAKVLKEKAPPQRKKPVAR